MAFKRNYKFSNNLPSAVPFAGVMLLFLFYLMSNSNHLLTEGSSLVRLPKGAKVSPSWYPRSVVVAMDKNANLYFYNQRISIEALGRELHRLTSREGSEEFLLILKADRAIRHEQIASFVEVAQRNGVERIWLATKSGLFNE
tara:strand:+ start:78 stop:503 length:426 start_codon:yes stop_codon:yes gene_type:complete